MISDQKKHIRPPLKRVLLVGDHTVPSAPILTLGRELNKLGVETLFSGNSVFSDTKTWVKLALRCRVLIFVQYRYGGPFFERQLQRARMMGCQVVRWWVGSDVMLSAKDSEAVSNARSLDSVVDMNIAVSPHLVEELDEIGIKADYLPSPCDLSALQSKPPRNLPGGVLTYLPTDRRQFYGEKVLIDAIEANPDLDFYIVSDESHSLRRYPNVRSLGWVKDMEKVWPKIGVLLRVTEHDGMPRMVLEALARGRYVIYSERFEGCWFARTSEQVNEYLQRFRELQQPNKSGPEVVQTVAGDTASLYLQTIRDHCVSAMPGNRLYTMLSAALHYR
ncbi:glycosyltransferase family 4 protein [Hydrocarboniclastica marina]|uniref:Glycosyltransferase family 1 protein n=1 Tax=Hydrocarboniclastica marina TaxID=2259620 RepID=A0A4P7XLA8_9ALTE|nr:glycosyltransferase family 4 protein [Hydrocarboniclastica marina]QCF26737.1 hypothetical protein soil367_12795 [Hydrocarboniclastica marina]